jgi:hypothetical protein
MRSIVVAITMAALALSGPVRGQELKTFSLDDPASLGLRITADTAVKTEGRASTRIETAWPVTVCLAAVEGLDVEGEALVFQAKVRTALKGQAVLEMWVRIDGKDYFSRALDRPVAGTSDWRSVETPFLARKGQKIERAWLNLIINGQGTVWVDDARLVRRPLPAG